MRTHTNGSIVELLDRYPGLFYPNQTWYRGEAFTRMLPGDVPATPPTSRIHVAKVPPKAAKLYRAVDLLNCYVQHPTDPIWDSWLWTADADADAQRVYVGGCRYGRGLQIHRHLSLDEKWAVPTWTASDRSAWDQERGAVA